MKRLSVRYLAGLMDGEGCIDFQKGFNKKSKTVYVRPRVRISMAESKHLLENIQNNFGGHINAENRSKNNPNWQQYYTWSLTSRSEVLKFLHAIGKHLILKKEQAKFAAWWLNTFSGRNRKSFLVNQLDKVREFAYEEMKLLKRDPQRLSERAIKAIKMAID